jgi:hypothetical protein
LIYPEYMPCYPSGVEKSSNENNGYENKTLPTVMIPAKKKQFCLGLDKCEEGHKWLSKAP